jgi:hypothetical protein
VIRTTKQLRCAAATHYLGATVAADIEKRTQDAIVSAHHQNRNAGKIIGAVLAGLSPFRRDAHQNRIIPEQSLLF